MNEHDTPQDQQLDQLLESATWPDADEGRLRRLESRWESLLDESSLKSTRSGRRAAPWRHRSVVWLAAAASLLIACSLWIIAVSKPAPETAESSQPANKSIHKTPEETRDSSGHLATTEPVKEPELTKHDYLAALAYASRKRRDEQPRTNTFRSVAELIATKIGSSPWLASATQVLVHNLDELVSDQGRTRQISRRQWNRYRKLRRDWEQWAWRYADSKTSRHQLGSMRFAIAISTQTSLQRLNEMASIDGLSHDAVMAISWLGQDRHVDQLIQQVPSQRSKRTLLLALLDRPGRQPALMFLQHLRNPNTSVLANNIANSTDQLPTEIWLGSIASHDRSRWDSALAVANICDQRVTQGLIRLAMDPTTSSSAMMALVKSRCADARKFVAYAENNQQLSATVMVARHRLQQIENETTRFQKRDKVRGM